jgi:hypothetical protein
MVWTKQSIIRELKRLHKSGSPLSYNALAKRKQALLSAAAYHFGSYRKAVERAGIAYNEVVRRPRWTKQTIIALIKKARRKDQDLSWSAVITRRDELAKAAFASLQPRLFGKWVRALQAAGLDADEVSRYRAWDRNTIVFELRERRRDKEDLSSGDLQTGEPALHAAAVRYFGAYDRALRAAGIDPRLVRRRRAWDRSAVARALRGLSRRGEKLSDTAVRKADPGLHGAAVRFFGSFTSARRAAGLD